MFGVNLTDKPPCVEIRKVMWSETVGLKTRPVSDQKIGLGFSFGLAGLALYVKCLCLFQMVLILVL